MKSYAVCYAMGVIQKRKLEFYVKGANGSKSEASNQNMAYNIKRGGWSEKYLRSGFDIA